MTAIVGGIDPRAMPAFGPGAVFELTVVRVRRASDARTSAGPKPYPLRVHVVVPTTYGRSRTSSSIRPPLKRTDGRRRCHATGRTSVEKHKVMVGKRTDAVIFFFPARLSMRSRAWA